MCNSKTQNVAASADAVNYYVITNNNETERPFGITAVLDNDPTDTETVENLFFSREEAVACCKWLAENNVFPVTLCEVLSDLYSL